MAPSSNSPPTGASPSAIDSGDSDSPVWRLESIPGKGKGLIATRDISPGTLILSEPPLITTDVIQSIETTEQDLARALKALPKDSQRAYLSLHNNYPGKNPLSNIVRSNGYPLGPNSDVGGVFPTVSRINHSCRPNAKHSWNPSLRQQTVYALRPIPAGDELSLSYLQGGTSEQRQQELQSAFGFTCRCEVCALPAAALRESDARLRRAQKLHDAIGDARACRLDPGRVVADGRALLALYAEDGVEDDRVPNVYWDMFQVCNMHGDVARASAFAREYCALKRVSEGPGSAAVEEVGAWVEDPARHESYGQTKKWTTRLEDVPSGVGREEYEKWLWREK